MASWQDVNGKLAGGSVALVTLFAGLFMLTGMSYTHSGDIMCEDTCESYINVTTKYWRICFDYYNETKYENETLFKKQTTSRTLHANLNKVDNIILTEPNIPVDWLVPARGKDNWRPIKGGDCWERGKINKIKLIGHKQPSQTVKWSFILEDKVDIDPMWEAEGYPIINKTLPSGTNIEIEKLYTTSECLIDCSFIFRIKLNESKTINDLSKFKPKFISYFGSNDFYKYNFNIRKNITYQETVYDYGLVEYNIGTDDISDYNIIDDSTEDCELGNGSTHKYIDIEWVDDRLDNRIYTVCYDRKNKNGIYWDDVGVIGSHLEDRWKYEWSDFNPMGKTIQADKDYYLKINAKRKAKLGKQSVDMIPSLFDHDFIEFDWFNSSWLYSKNITLNTSLINGSNTNFPILININDCDLNKSQADGDDILFTDITGTTQLSHEIEFWNTTSCELQAWVRMPVLNTTENQLQIYYGNALATNQQNMTGVWDSDFTLVQHLQETNITSGGAGNMKDSTSNSNNGTTTNMIDADHMINGKIDGSLNFSGTSGTDYIDLTPVLNPHTYNNFTMSVWYNSSITTLADDGIFWQHAQSGVDFLVFSVGDDPGFVNNVRLLVGGTFYNGGIDLADKNWHNIVFVRTDSRIIVYVDGVIDINVTDSEPGALVIDAPVSGPNIGDVPGNTEQLAGNLDEFKFSEVSRSTDWIITEYNNQVNPSSFHSFSAEQTEAAGAPDINFFVATPAGFLRFLDCSPDSENPDSRPGDQTTTISAINATNNGTATGDFTINLTGAISSGWDIWASNDSLANNITLNTTAQTIWSSVTAGQTKQVWLAANCSFVTSGPGVSIDMQVV